MASPLRKVYDQMNIKEAMSKPCKFERSILSHDEHSVTTNMRSSCAVTIPKVMALAL
jgi:hypothetical protein